VARYRDCLLMNSEPKKILPKLRFPDFKNDGEWQKVTLNEVAVLLKGKGISKADVVPNGTQPCIRYGELYTTYAEVISSVVSFTNANKEELVLSETKDVIIPSSGETREDIATASCVINAGVALGGDLNIIRSSIDGVYLAYYITHVKKKAISKLAQGDAVVHLYLNQLRKLDVDFPDLQAEQQKIAACLSSLEELISAESQKLDALKVHKNGLMQLLFPAEGNTVPTRRFAEFTNNGEWTAIPLTDMVDKVGSGTTPLGGDSNYIESGRPFVRSQNVGWGSLLLDDIVFIDEQLHKHAISTELKFDDVLLNITGASIGRSAVVDQRIERGNVNQHVCIIRTIKNKLNPHYLNQYLISDYGQSQIDSYQAGGNRQGLNFAQIRSFQVPMPPSMEEQQKIASCLSSLDHVISAQAEKIEALKLHKEGLMQQLFPQISESTPDQKASNLNE
jgi:type I restriction enzyme, S subunit